MSDFETAMAYCRITVISLGILGNVISFMVFSRKTFCNNSISTYFRALAIFDCLTIIQLIKDIYSLSPNNYFENLSDVNCKLFYYISMQFSSIPGWILVAFSIDKMLNMKTSPPNILKSKLFQWSIVAGIVLFNILFYIELLISLKLEPFFLLPEIRICNFAFLSYFYPFLYSMLAEICVIPFSIMIVTSIVTIISLRKSRLSIKRDQTTDKLRKTRDIKYAVSSVAFNFFFITFKLPFFFYYILPVNFVVNSYFQVSFLLFLFNCSSNFLIHFATNSIFRRELNVICQSLLPNNRVLGVFSSS